MKKSSKQSIALRNRRQKQSALARSGASVDTTGTVWLLGPSYQINWELFSFLPEPLLFATKEYFRFQIGNGAPAYVRNQFSWLKRLLLSMAREIVKIEPGNTIDLAFFFSCQNALTQSVGNGTVSNYLDAYRRWYVWCADIGFDHFDVDVAIELQERTIGGNLKGIAVLRQDSDEGPLRDVELDAVLSKLKHATEDGLLPLRVLVATWLMVAFGTNPKNLALLNAEDLTHDSLSSSYELYKLQIPRIKKRDAKERTQFKGRTLLPQIGRLVEKLSMDNGSIRKMDPLWDGGRFATPLFCRRSPNLKLIDTDFEFDAYRVDVGWFREALREFVEYFSLKSIDGKPLTLTPRRLRYTFATRLVREGASPRELAEALDHTDLQHVMVYFNSRSDVVPSLDRALAEKLAPYVQAFMGRIVEDETVAVRGDDPGSRIYSLKSHNKRLEPLGSCGSSGICGLYAPIACYTCRNFQAWADAPHQEVLDELLAQRERRANIGGDPRLTMLHDQTILAVSTVIEKCKAKRDGEDIQSV